MDSVKYQVVTSTVSERSASFSNDSNLKNVVPRRVSTTKPLGDDLIDLDNGIEDKWVQWLNFDVWGIGGDVERIGHSVLNDRISVRANVHISRYVQYSRVGSCS